MSDAATRARAGFEDIAADVPYVERPIAPLVCGRHIGHKYVQVAERFPRRG